MTYIKSHFRLGSNSHYLLTISYNFCLNKLLITAYTIRRIWSCRIWH